MGAAPQVEACRREADEERVSRSVREPPRFPLLSLPTRAADRARRRWDLEPSSPFGRPLELRAVEREVSLPTRAVEREVSLPTPGAPDRRSAALVRAPVALTRGTLSGGLSGVGMSGGKEVLAGSSAG